MAASVAKTLRWWDRCGVGNPSEVWCALVEDIDAQHLRLAVDAYGTSRRPRSTNAYVSGRHYV